VFKQAHRADAWRSSTSLGAGGAAGWSQLNGMTADGYTVMGTNLPHIVLQPLQKDVGYQTDDLTTRVLVPLHARRAAGHGRQPDQER
jgi:hypothetical protein